jgi:DNA helicase HerA-like ATPase
LADTDDKIFVGAGELPAWLTLALANRHGLVTGATGTGKTVSLQVMAEGFARAGVPVFASDIKGDLSGISQIGEAKDFIAGCAIRSATLDSPPSFRASYRR